MSPIILISALSVIVVFFFVMGIISLTQSGQDKADKRVKDRLKALSMNDVDVDGIDLLLRDPSARDVPFLTKLFEKMRWVSKLDMLIYQADAKGSPTGYMILCFVLGSIGAYMGFLTGRLWLAALCAFLLGYAPLFVLKNKKRKRVMKFGQQLPEALDLMARALKAGHTFGGGMRMVADEFGAPIGPEFGKTLDEINYGKDVDKALANLQDRVDCDDLKFFTVSVNIQRETGGNLAEIIDKISRLVRDRFALFGKIRVLSAEGRVSAYILVGLPFVIVGILFVVNPDYISLLWKREVGQQMIWASIASMVMGVLVIRKIITIKV